MNDRVSEELLARAAGEEVARITGAMAIITAEYDGSAFAFRGDGWFNATAAAERFGRKPAAWLRLPETERYLEALCQHFEVRKSHFVKTSRGGDRKEQGTWLHPKLAVRFARWLDVNFEIWCDAQIDKILRGTPAASDDLPSAFADRRCLHQAALDMVGLTGMLFSTAHKINNAVVGTKHYPEMTKGGIRNALPVIQRLADGAGTPQDHALVEAGLARNGESPQLALELQDPLVLAANGS